MEKIKISLKDAIKEIEVLKKKLSIAEECLIEIDAIPCDFGYYESAAKSMKALSFAAISEMDKVI